MPALPVSRWLKTVASLLSRSCRNAHGAAAPPLPAITTSTHISRRIGTTCPRSRRQKWAPGLTPLPETGGGTTSDSMVLSAYKRLSLFLAGRHSPRRVLQRPEHSNPRRSQRCQTRFLRAYWRDPRDSSLGDVRGRPRAAVFIQAVYRCRPWCARCSSRCPLLSACSSRFQLLSACSSRSRRS